MPGVAEVDAGLGGSLVAAHLQADGVLAGVELLLSELASVLLGLLGAQARLAVAGRLRARTRVRSGQRWTCQPQAPSEV